LLVSASSAFGGNKYDDASTVRAVQAYLNGIESLSAEFHQVTGSGKVTTGKILLQKTNGGPHVAIYCNETKERIVIKDGYVRVSDQKRYPIAGTPAYVVLSGNLDLNKTEYELIENNNEIVRIQFLGKNNVVFIFSLYPNTGAIRKLEAWVIEAGSEETLVSLDTDTLRLNDKKTVKELESFQ
jgi:outer membrane lipoprotein-sorting protein